MAWLISGRRKPGALQRSSLRRLVAVDPTMAAAAKLREVAPFLKSLRRILDGEDARILRWTTDGKAFEIHDMDAMMKQVLPKYFKHGK
jgi:hypothetical protein